MSSLAGPPRWASRVIATVLPKSVRAVVLGDLHERYARRARDGGRASATWWLLRQIASFAIRVPGERSRAAAWRLRDRWQRTVAGGLRDFSHAGRSLRRAPSFTLPVVAVFAVAIAANAMVISLVDAVLVRELPYPDPDSLVMIWDRPTEPPFRDTPITSRHFDTWRERRDIFAAIGAFETYPAAVEWAAGTERTSGTFVSAGLLEELGARSALGRLLVKADEEVGAPDIMLLSHRTWRTRFGADPNVVGRRLTVNGEPVEIVGVVDGDFWFFDPYMFVRSVGDRVTAEPAYWMPLRSGDVADESRYDYPMLRLVARLAPGIDREAAEAAVVAQRAELRASDGRNDFTARVVSLRSQMLDDADRQLGFLGAAVGMVLLIACTNVASLVMSRSTARRSELELRRALGASAWQVARVALAESTWLGLLGGLAGLMLSAPLLGAVVRLTPRDMPLIHRTAMDARVVVVTLAVAWLAGLFAGLPQALRSLRRDRLTSDERTVTPTGRLRSGLVIVQVAISVALLVGAALMGAAFTRLMNSDPGFVAERVLTFEASMAGRAAPPPTFFNSLIEGIDALPGVIEVGGSAVTPFGRMGVPRTVRPAEAEERVEPLGVEFRWITPEYFSTIRLPLLGGRGFTPADDSSSARVGIVNEALAERLSPGSSPIGSMLEAWVGPGEPERIEIVGVVVNEVFWRLGEAPRPFLYVPVDQTTPFLLHVAVRTGGDPAALVGPIRRLANELDPHVPLSHFESLEELMRASISQERFFARLLAIFGGLALLLATAGIYGMVAYSAQLRLPEMGVRKAFGARPARLLWLMLGRSLRPVALGMVAGVAGSVALGRTLAATVDAVPAVEPAALVTALLAFAAIAVVAAIVPARRAARVDAAETLRGV